jgi:hypothetical protein
MVSVKVKEINGKRQRDRQQHHQLREREPHLSNPEFLEARQPQLQLYPRLELHAFQLNIDQLA